LSPAHVSLLGAVKITVRFSAKALAGANAGVDLDASSERYRDALIAAVVGDFADALVDIARDDTASLVVRVEAVDDPRAREVERSVTDLAWVVKQCAPWSLPAR
jgi:hypothetical protein